jgi:hypothetical protein
MAYARTVVVRLDDHGRLQALWVLLQALDVVAIVGLAAVLDEHGAFDARFFHVVEQGVDGFVFVEAAVAVGVD